MKCFTKISFYLSSNRAKFSLLVLFTGLLFVEAFILQSCEKNTFTSKENGPVIVSKNSDNEYFADMDFGDCKFTYFTQTNTLKSSCGTGGPIRSNFQVKKGNTVIYNTTFELDTTIKNYRLLQHKEIEEIAKSLSNNLTNEDYEYLSTNMETFIKGAIKSKSLNSTSLQSLFFHLAIVNIKKRENQTGLIESIPSPFYIVGQSFYADIKDLNISKKTVQKVLKLHPETTNHKGGSALVAFINNFSGDNIPFEKLYYLFIGKQQYIHSLVNMLNTKTQSPMQKSIRILPNKQAVAAVECEDAFYECSTGLCGSDWGCCGNYQGCCYLASWICYLHDAACVHCSFWWCLPGCVPDDDSTLY